MDAEGNVEYVSKLTLNSNALQLFASPGGELLRAPRGDLCIRTCAPAPLRSAAWFSDSEARCPPPKGAAAAGGVAKGLELLNAAGVRNAFLKLNQKRGCLGAEEAGNGCGPTKTHAGAGGGALFSMESVLRMMKGESAYNSGTGARNERFCMPLEARYEPMAFSHSRRRQNNLYYRFEVLPLGAKCCCCF